MEILCKLFVGLALCWVDIFHVPIVFAQDGIQPPIEDTPDSEIRDEDIFNVEALDELQGPQVFFDADSTGFSRDGSKQLFEGNVVAIGRGIIVASDVIEVDHANKILEAKGHTVIISGSQIFIGEWLIYHMDQGTFFLENGSMITNDSLRTQALTEEVLGITARELDFESARKQRLAEISVAKNQLKERFRSNRLGGKEDPSIVERYALLLEKKDAIEKQINPALSLMAPTRRDNVLRRRQFWEKNKDIQSRTQANQVVRFYFRIKGKQIEKISENEFVAREAVITPCRCEDDEIPAWGFRSEKVETQIGGYADLDHPIFEIKGIPVLYLPFLKIPVKDERQSGFLLPDYNWDNYLGSVITQPVYIAIDDHNDATITTELLEKKGTRLGLELRRQSKVYSGWQLNIEAIRDRTWLEDASSRRDYIRAYELGLSEAASNYVPAQNFDLGLKDQQISGAGRERLKDPEWWRSAGLEYCLMSSENQEACNEGVIQNYLNPPKNPWRGKMTWNGLSVIAPRLTAISEGEILSDHRYNQDLSVARSINEAYGGQELKSFTKAKGIAHVDAQNFYLGLGSTFGDNLRLNQRFAGQNIPAYLSFQSRMFPLLDPFDWPTPYGQFDFKLKYISSEKGESIAFSDPQQPQNQIRGLGDGNWVAGRFSLISPILSDMIVQVHHFADAEVRLINHNELPTAKMDSANDDWVLLDKLPSGNGASSIQSWKTGLKFNLPIDGIMKWDSKGQGTGGEAGSDDETYLQHSMNWGLALTLRPAVVRRGAYGEVYDQVDEFGNPIEGAKLLTYFAEDRRTDDVVFQKDVRYEGDDDAMVPHQKVTFSTSHEWHLFSKKWTRIPGVGPPQKNENGQSESYQDRAIQELRYGDDEPISDTDQMFGDDEEWFLDRYQLEESDRIVPVTFAANMSYDRVKEEQRTRQKKEGTTSALFLAEPWSPFVTEVSIRYSGWSLRNLAEYNIYKHLTTKLSFGLSTPKFLATGVGLSYVVEKQPIESMIGGFDQKVTATRGVHLSSNLIPRVSSNFSYKLQKIDDDPEAYYESRVGLSYNDRSECWGLNFVRVKEFLKDERQASYQIQFYMTFYGIRRPFDVSPSVMREYEKATGTDDSGA